MTRCSTFPRATRTTITTSSTSARRSWRPALRFTRSSRRPDGGRRTGTGRGRHHAGPAAEAVVPAPLPGVADGTVVPLLRHLLPGTDGDPGGVLAGDPARIRRPQLRVRPNPVPPDRKLAVRHDLRADTRDGVDRDCADDRGGLSARLLDGPLPHDVQDAGPAARGRAVLDVVLDPHLRTEDHPGPQRIPRPGSWHH